MPIGVRARRYNALVSAGFTDREAVEYSRVSFDVPYMKPLIKAREAMLDTALKNKVSPKVFRLSIANLYKKNKWMTRDKTGKRKIDPYRMLRDFENRFRAKYPEYQSPWEKRHKDISRVREKIKTGLGLKTDTWEDVIQQQISLQKEKDDRQRLFDKVREQREKRKKA